MQRYIGIGWPNDGTELGGLRTVHLCYSNKGLWAAVTWGGGKFFVVHVVSWRAVLNAAQVTRELSLT